MLNPLKAAPVLLVKHAPIVGTKVPLRKVPNARSAAADAPKLITSPVVPLPVSAAYWPLLRALVPLSANAQPVNAKVLAVPLVAKPLKSCVYALPNAVREIHAACAAGTKFNAANIANAKGRGFCKNNSLIAYPTVFIKVLINRHLHK
jgi:hypothetical protein